MTKQDIINQVDQATGQSKQAVSETIKAAISILIICICRNF